MKHNNGNNGSNGNGKRSFSPGNPNRWAKLSSQSKITEEYIFLLRNGHKQIKFGNFGGGGGGHLKGGQSGSYGEGSNGAQVCSHYTWYTKYRNGFFFCIENTDFKH